MKKYKNGTIKLDKKDVAELAILTRLIYTKQPLKLAHDWFHVFDSVRDNKFYYAACDEYHKHPFYRP